MSYGRRKALYLSYIAASALLVASAGNVQAQQAPSAQSQPSGPSRTQPKTQAPASPAATNGDKTADGDKTKQPRTTSETANLDTITVTATETPESVINTLAGASTVTSDEINRMQPGSIAQMLSNVPGVASEESQNDPEQSINLRGMQDFGRVNVLVDGARQDYQISGHNASGTFYLDPAFIGQADVVRGPVSNIYGSGAIGGVVSLQTRTIDDILNPDQNYGAVQTVGGGTNGSGFLTSSSAAARIGTAADLYGQFVYRGTSPYSDGNGDKVPDTGSNLTGGLLKFNVRPADGQQISATALMQDYRFSNDGTSGEGARFGDNVSTGTYTLGYTFNRPDLQWLNLSVKTYYSTTDNHQTAIAPDDTYAALGVVPGDKLSDNINTYGFDANNTARFSTGGIDHILTFGGDSVWDRVKTIDNAGGYVAALTPSGNRRLSGAFVQDEVHFTDWLRMIGGVRYDDYSLTGGGVSSSGSHVSPKITIGIKPFQGMEFYGTYAEAYRAPSITETLIQGTHPFPAFNILPNPNLLPETAHNFEGGVNIQYDNIFTAGDSFRAKATGFVNKIDNYIDLATVGAPYLVPEFPGAPTSLCDVEPGFCFPITSYQYINVTKARVSGLELEGAYDWGKGFFSLAGSADDGKNLDDRTSLQTVVPYRLSSTLGFRFFDSALTAGARWTLVSGSAKDVATPSKAYTLVDLFASYAFNDRISGNINITNLFNRQYTQYLNSDASPGLTAKFSLTVKFASK